MFALLEKLEDPEMPFMGPNIKALKFWGVLIPNNSPKKNLHLLFYVLVTLFVGTEYIDIWYIKEDLKLLLNNVKITMLATMSIVKLTTFYYWKKRWFAIIDYVNATDLAMRANKDPKKMALIDKFTKYCRKMTYMYWLLLVITVVVVIVHPVLKFLLSPTYRRNTRNGTEPYLEVVSSWIPFDKSTTWGYLFASAYQAFSSIVGGGWITSFDSNAMVIMVFFRMELEILRIDCANIFGTEVCQVSDEVAVKRFKECHKRHVDLMKYARLFDACLSPIMLCYMFICSVMLCVTAYQIMSETSAIQRLVLTEYLIMGVTQLFIYCWHSNDVLFASLDLQQAPFESIWWARAIKHRKNLIMLMAQFGQIVEFSAGPFTKLNVSTFIQILKGAYSYYTLLSKSQMK